MPVYNTEKYLKEAIDSILNQTFTDFEFIIIDDASTDRSVKIIESYTDTRIRLIGKPKNTGLTESLNMGLKLAKGKYVARMDSDDISDTNRFETQIKFMESNPEIDVCGTWFTIMGSNEVVKHPRTHSEIKIGLLSYCTVGHPTVMIKAKVLKENNLYYDPTFEPAEDYNLWSKISMIGKLHNLQNSLLSYRVHSKQVSSLFKKKQDLISSKIRVEMLNNLLHTNQIDINLFELEMGNSKALRLSDSLRTRFKYIKRLKFSNNEMEIFKIELFNALMEGLKKQLTIKFFHSSKAHNLNEFLSSLWLVFGNLRLVQAKMFLKYFVKSIIKYKL